MGGAGLWRQRWEGKGGGVAGDHGAAIGDEDGDAWVSNGFVDAVNGRGEEVTGAAGVGDCGCGLGRGAGLLCVVGKISWF